MSAGLSPVSRLSVMLCCSSARVQKFDNNIIRSLEFLFVVKIKPSRPRIRCFSGETFSKACISVHWVQLSRARDCYKARILLKILGNAVTV